MDFSVVYENVDLIGRGLIVTVSLTAVICIAGTLCAVPLALALRSRQASLRRSAVAVVEVGKGLPLLTLLVWIHYAVPTATGISISAFWNAVIAFTFSLAAFLSDILRGGIEAIPRGHVEAALALGFDRRTILRRILLPETVRRSLPGISAMYITALKLSVLASVIGVPELQYMIRLINIEESKPYELYSALAVIFLVLVIPTSLLARRLESHPWFALAPHGQS